MVFYHWCSFFYLWQFCFSAVKIQDVVAQSPWMMSYVTIGTLKYIIWKMIWLFLGEFWILKTHKLKQWFSNLSLLQHSLEDSDKTDSLEGLPYPPFTTPGAGPTLCVSDKLPVYTGAAGLQAKTYKKKRGLGLACFGRIPFVLGRY